MIDWKKLGWAIAKTAASFAGLAVLGVAYFLYLLLITSYPIVGASLTVLALFSFAVHTTYMISD